MKRVLIVSQDFYPESFRINELAFSLAEKGYHVDALVGIPNYPKGKYFDGYGLFHKRKEIVNGVNIYRCFLVPRGTKGSLIQLSLNYLTFWFSACLWVLFFFAFKKKYDCIISFQMSPVTQVMPAILLKKLRKTKLITWVQDIWPDSITDSTSGTANKFLLPPLSAITEHVYKHSDKLLITSVGMSELICRKNDYSEKIEYTPNWCADFYEVTQPFTEELLDGFILMMAGNIGDGLGIDSLKQLFVQLDDLKDLFLVFVGDGSAKEELENYTRENKLTQVVFLGRFPYDAMPGIYEKADAMLVTLMETPFKHLDVTVPSRVQSYMSAGKPIFAMIGSGARDVIEESNCGFVVPAGDYKGLATLIRNNYKNHSLLKEKGNNAREAYLKQFTLGKGVDHFINLIES